MSETESPASDGPAEQGQTLLEYFQQNGTSWGAADLFMLGPRGEAHRLAEFIAILLATAKESGGRTFGSVCIAIPPGDGDGSQVLEKVKAAFPESVKRLRGTLASPVEVAGAFLRVKCERCASMDGVALAQLVERVEERSAIIVPRAARYRVTGISSNGKEPEISEDIWAPHIHALVRMIGAAAASAQKYIVVDAGEFVPARQQNLDLLMTCEWGVTGAKDPEGSPLEMFERAKRWHALAHEGRLGTVVAEINAINGVPQAAKDLMRLHTFLELGLQLQVRDELERRPELTSGLDASTALRVAMLAEEADADTIAVHLLGEAANGLEALEDLENALQLADALQQIRLTQSVSDNLARRFPHSPVLRRHRLSLLLNERNYTGAADLLAAGSSPEDVKAHAYYKRLAAVLSEQHPFDVGAALDELSREYPTWKQQTLRFCALHLEALGRRGEALNALVSAAQANTADVDRGAFGLALDMTERARLVLDPQLEDHLVLRIAEWLARDLARLPSDGFLRLRLAKLVSPEVLGSTGLPTIASVVLSLFQRPVQPRSVVPLDQRAAACSTEETAELFERGMTWFASERPILLGVRRFPADLLNVPAEQAVAGLAAVIEHMCGRLQDNDDVQTIEAVLVLAVAIAPLSSDPNQDLKLLRHVAAAFALSGKVQKARDLAEQGLRLAKDGPQRRRLAWHAFADVYTRLGNFNEALIAMACCAAADDRPDWEQIWSESLVLLRIFRDLGLVELGRPLIAPARRALNEMRAHSRFFARLETVELQIKLFEFGRRKDVPHPVLVDFVGEVATNTRKVLELRDEIEPAASLLANVLLLAAERKIDVAGQYDAVLAKALKESSPAFRLLIEATASLQPSVEQLLPLVCRLESARHPEDVGFDVRSLTVAAERSLGAAAGLSAEDATYVTELLTDQAIALPSESPTSRFLGADRNGPASAAVEISKLGIDVIMIAKGSAGLVRTVAAEGVLHGPYVEGAAVFSSERLSDWAAKYPYGYKQVADVNEFYLSTSGIGVSQVPKRAVVIAGTDLQSFPPNLLNVGDDLAGRTRCLASAPSLAWLKSAVSKSSISDGRITAWIPDAEPEAGLATLAVIAERLRDSFDAHGVLLSSGSTPPSGLAGSEMAIVAAHGGLSEEARYFRVVADDVDLAIAASALSGALSEIGVVVLFVCSGGRLDKHPGASTTIGLVKRLLDRGCSAVVAPPWPLDVSVPPHWLPTFLAKWTAGHCVIDACFSANQAVLGHLGDDPSKYLAMSVYGNPLARRSVQETPA